MAVDDELKNYIKAVRVEHDRRIDETYQRKGEQGAVSLSSSFDDEVSLRGGAYIWDKVRLAQNSSVYAYNGGYWDFTSSTINSNNLHYTGNHVFDDKITLKSGLYTADSMRTDFGDYGSIKATNDTINVSQSTITGNVTFTGNDKFSGHVTLQSSTEFQDDITVADSLDVDLGSGGKIFARRDTIEVAGSTIHGDHRVNGNIYYEQKQHFLDDIVAHGGVSLVGALSGADSLSHNFGSYTSIKAQNDTLDFRNSYIRFDDATLSGYSLGGGDYTLPTASNSVKGGIKVGTGLIMQGDTLHAVQSTTVILDTVPSTVEGAIWYVL